MSSVVVYDEVLVTVEEESTRALEVETDLQTVIDVEHFPPKPQVQLELGTRGVQGPRGDQGEQGPRGETGGSYVHHQLSAETTWVINHGLEMYPNVTVLNSAGEVSFGGIEYLSSNQIILTFSAATGGVAYLS